MPCGCKRAQMPRNAPFSCQPSLFSLFALRVVAAQRPVISRVWRGLSAVNHGHRFAEKPLRIEPVDHPPLLDPVLRQGVALEPDQAHAARLLASQNGLDDGGFQEGQAQQFVHG